MIEIMVDRLHSNIFREAIGMTQGTNQSSQSPIMEPLASAGVSYNIDTRLLPLFASYVASAQTPNGLYNLNRSNEEILIALQKLKSQSLVPDGHDSDSAKQVRLLTNARQSSSALDGKSESSFQGLSLQSLSAHSTIRNTTCPKQPDTRQREEMAAALPSKKRSSSLSSSNHSSKKQKSIRNESKVSENNLPTFSIQLSDSERRETFPLPPRPAVSLSKLPLFSKLWDDYEMICYNMDDTVADQRAFVKKLFVQSLHRSKMSHLKHRTQLVSTTTTDIP